MKKFAAFYLICMIIGPLARSQSFVQLSGKITDKQSRPIVHASVFVLNTNFGMLTDEQGNFTIKHIPAGNYSVQVSAIGFASVYRDVQAGKENTVLHITLSGASTQLDAVVVTAQKKEELLQRVPFSISSLSSKEVRNYRLWNTRELTAIVPNLYSADPGDNRNVTSIRGITSTSYDPAVATYIDGVNQFGLDTYIAQLFDVERIEILRGPQGTLYGRNAMGGVINIITKQPTNQTEGFVELSMGNYGQQRYGLGFRTPLIKNKLFFGLSEVYEGRHGYYSNQFNNQDFDRQHSITGNYFLKYLPAADWTVTLNARQHINRDNGAFPLVNGVQEAFDHPFKLDQDAVTKMIDNTFNASLSATYTGRTFNFSTQSAWQSNHRYYTDPIDGDFSPADAVSIINNYGNAWNNVKVFTQECKFTSPAAAATWKWTGGAYFFYQDNPVKQATRFGKDAALVGAPDSNFSIINTSKGKSMGEALYAQVSWSVNKAFEITAGLRYDHEHQEQHVLSEYQHDPDPNPVFPLIPDTAASVSFNAISPKLSVAWHISRSTNIYVTYSRGYRPGGLTQVSSDPSQPPLYGYKPEYSNNVEAGLKSSMMDNHVRFNLAVFYTIINNAQVPTLVLPDAITVIKNAGKLNSKGVEAELAATLPRGWELVYNAGITDATYETLKLSGNGTETDLAGKRQVFTPKITSSLALQYTRALTRKKEMDLVIREEWMYLGTEYFDLANTIQQDPYSLFHTRAGITTRHLDLMFWMRNMGNQKYIAYAYDFGAVHLGNPRIWGITLTGKL